MDLVYIPEVLAFGSFRNPQYRDYEQPWNKDYFKDYGKTTQLNCQKKLVSKENCQPKLVSKNCYLCRESKRRTLAAYIREKSRRNSCQEIHEEEEEEHEGSKDRKDETAEHQGTVKNAKQEP